MILLHEQTRTLLQRAAESPVHAVLLTGPEGAGKLYVARYFAAKKLSLDDPERLDSHPYFRIISAEKDSIGINQIREIQNFLRLKTPGQAATKRIVVLENAHLMTQEAQNALLKTLEEPPADTVVVMTAPKTTRLAETIYSRVRQIPVLSVSKEQALEYHGSEFDEASVEKAFTMSGGNAGLLSALLQNKDHELLEHINIAKTILAGSRFERLKKVDGLSKNKTGLRLFIRACKLISSTAMHQALAKGDERRVRQWHKRLQLVHEAEAALVHNPNTKLLLTNLFLQM